MRHGWSLEPEIWDLATEELVSLKWQRVPLEKNLGSSVPSAGGVYMICANVPPQIEAGTLIKGLYNVIYIGSSLNLKARLSDHLRGDRERVVLARGTYRSLDFLYAVVPGATKQVVEEVETRLVLVFGPPANEVLPNREILGTVGSPVPLSGGRTG